MQTTLKTDQLDKLHKTVQNPDVFKVANWNSKDPAYKWHDFIGDYTKSIWNSLTMKQRAALYLDACDKVEDDKWK